MISSLQRPIRMTADDEQTDHRHDVQHREQQADGQIVFDPQPLLYEVGPQNPTVGLPLVRQN